MADLGTILAMQAFNRSPAGVRGTLPLEESETITVTEKGEPIDPAVYQELLRRAEDIDSVKAQRTSAKNLGSILQQLKTLPVQPDLSPTAGVLKALYGTDVGYKAPESGKDRLLDIAKIQKLIAETEGSTTNDILNAIKSGMITTKTSVGKTTKDEQIKKPNLEESLTPGQKAADVKFGQEYQDYYAQGGYAGVQKSLNLLKSAKERLNKNSKLSGGYSQMLPDAIRKKYTPESFALQQEVQETAVDGLKKALGSQFTEKDREIIMGMAYDPLLPAEENQKKIQKAIDYIEERAKAKDKSAQFFEKKGTLKGLNATDIPEKPTGLSPEKQKRLKELRDKKAAGKLK